MITTKHYLPIQVFRPVAIDREKFPANISQAGQIALNEKRAHASLQPDHRADDYSRSFSPPRCEAKPCGQH